MGNMEDIDVEIMEAIKKSVKTFRKHFDEYDVTLRLTIKVDNMFINSKTVMTEITYKECD